MSNAVKAALWVECNKELSKYLQAWRDQERALNRSELLSLMEAQKRMDLAKERMSLAYKAWEAEPDDGRPDPDPEP